MKKTLLVMAMVIALAMSAMAGAVAKNAPGHANNAVKGTAWLGDFNGTQEIDYLYNNSGYHYWFTAGTDLGRLAPYTEGHEYHSIYKYEVDDPDNWCRVDEREIVGDSLNYVEPRNSIYYKRWNVTLDEPSCGVFDLASGDVTYVPSGDHLTDATFSVQVSPAGAQGDVAVTNHWQGDKNVNFTGEITCAEKAGDVLYFAGSITSYQNVTTSPTTYFYFSIQDGSPDLIRVLRSDTWESCDYAGAPLREVVAGDLVIH